MQNKKNQFTNSIIKDRIEVIENSENKLIFRTFLEPNGGQNQLHYHSKLDESFKIVKGELTIIINNIEKKNYIWSTLFDKTKNKPYVS